MIAACKNVNQVALEAFSIPGNFVAMNSATSWKVLPGHAGDPAFQFVLGGNASSASTFQHGTYFLADGYNASAHPCGPIASADAHPAAAAKADPPVLTYHYMYSSGDLFVTSRMTTRPRTCSGRWNPRTVPDCKTVSVAPKMGVARRRHPP